MAARREIEFTIGPDGEVRIAVKGVKGEACDLLTRDIEQALGIVTAKEHTSEYWQSNEATVQLRDSGEG